MEHLVERVRDGAPAPATGPRVLHVTTQVSDQGGAEVSLLHFLGHLQALGVDSTVLPLFSRRTSTRLPELRRAGVTVLDPPDGGVLRHAARLRREQRRVRPDVVHSTLWEADLAARLASPGSGTRHVVSLVNTPYAPHAVAAARSPRRLELVRHLEGWSARQVTTAFHAITQAVADSAVEHLGIDPQRIRVIPRGRDRSLLGEPGTARRLRARAALGVPPDAEVVLSVARQEPQKGLQLLVRAFAEVAAARPAAVLVQAGRHGSSTAAVQAEVDRWGLGPRVRLLGRREDVPELLAAADVLGFSSLWEGLGGAVLEAMALQLPVVGFDVPAVREVLAGTGRLVPAGDVGQLAAGLLDVLQRPEHAALLAARARARFDQHHGIDAVAARMANFYRDVADGRLAP